MRRSDLPHAHPARPPRPRARAWAPLTSRAAAAARRAAELLGVAGEPDAPTLSLAGLVLIGLTSALIAAATVGMVAASRLEANLDAVAREAVRALENSLDEIGAELAATDTLAPAGCGRETEAHLVRASLASRYARRIFLAQHDDGSTCTPLSGEEVLAAHVEDLRAAAGASRLVLAPGLLDRRYVLAMRAGARARTVAAQIDTDRLVVDLPFQLQAYGRQIQVRDATGRTLMHSTNPGPTPRTRFDPLVERRARSARYGLLLSAGADQDMIRAAIGERLVAIAGLFLFLMAGGLAGTRLWVAQRQSIERRLRLAVRRRQFEPFVQPIVDARSGACVGGEILMRWNHPARGIVAPADFIALAEQTGLIVPMSRMLMIKARDRLAPIAAEDRSLRFAFNLSATELRDPTLPERMDAIFDDDSLPASQVGFELIERDVVDARIRENLARLRERGYRIAIDDFGTGQSNLSVLGQVGFDRLKIDREFVRAIDSETVNGPVLDTIIDLAARLGVSAVAEGVETDVQRNYLVERGVDMLQGYLIARPMPIEQFAGWLAGNRARHGRDAQTMTPDAFAAPDLFATPDSFAAPTAPAAAAKRAPAGAPGAREAARAGQGMAAARAAAAAALADEARQ